MEELLKKAAEVTDRLLPDKSRTRYEEEYNKFCDWCEYKNVNLNQVNDEVMLVYLSEKSKLMKPSTLWSRFSMIKSCLKLKQNIDCTTFFKSLAFLKRQSVGFVPKKSNVLSADEVSQFMINAQDSNWLLTKVILCFGIFGACRRDDLTSLTIDDVKDNGNFFLVLLEDGKTHKRRSFTITDEGCPFQPTNLLRKYMALRPAHTKTKKFFIAYRSGKCYAQNVGVNTIGSVPKKVAQFLKLENPNNYTGHSLRRSSATMLVEGGGDLLTLKRHGGWRSSNVAEGYVEESVTEKINVSKKLFNSVTSASTSTTPADYQPENALMKERQEYFTLDEILNNSSDEEEKQKKTPKSLSESVMRNKDEMKNQHDLTTYAKVQALQNKLANKVINISNNSNCTVNVNFNF